MLMSTPVAPRNPADLYERLLPSGFMSSDLDALRERYRSAKPYPHICMDGIFDEVLLDQINAEWPSPETRDWLVYDTKNELKQTSRGIEGLSPLTQAFLLQLCSPAFVKVMKAITGHENLLPDPLFVGAGLMETFRGGWLEIHGDYTRHPHLPLSRRINLLIYLNRDWDEAWHGELELWDPATNAHAVSFSPLFNRTVIFDTNADALHGHPVRLNCPANRSRRVIALYYWSASDEDVQKAKPINFVSTRVPPMRAMLRGCVPPIVIDLGRLALRRHTRANGSSLFPRTLKEWNWSRDLKNR